MSVFVRQNAISMEYTKDSWAILNPIEQSIKAKIEKYGTPLKDWDVSIYRGILTGCNEAFIISGEQRKKLIAEDPKSDEIIRPILRGRDIKRYGYDFADLWLIATFPSKHYNIDNYPAVKKWLKSFGKKLEQTGEEYIDEFGKKTKCRKKTNNKWFETQDSIAYWNDFSKQKIVWSDIATEPTFALVDAGIYFNNTCYMLCNAPEYILPILNSPLIDWYFRKIATDLGGGSRYFKQFVEILPILKIVNHQHIALLQDTDRNRQYEFISELYHLTAEEKSFISENIHFQQ